MNKLLKIALSFLLGASLYTNAQALDWDSQSLVGVEFGYGSMDVEGEFSKESKNPILAGVKLGSKNKNFRLYLSANYLNISDFDFSMMYGADVQYLFPLTREFDVYVGLNGGVINLSFDPSRYDSLATAGGRDILQYYAGADVGMDYIFSKEWSAELGLRYLYLDIAHTKFNETYKIDSMTQLYMGLIYRYYTH
jgi:hypothetical protein